MPTALKIALYLILPMVWGLAVEWVFEALRRRRAGRQGPSQDEQACCPPVESGK